MALSIEQKGITAQMLMYKNKPHYAHLICAGDGQPVKDWEKDLRCHHHRHYIGETIISNTGSVAVYLQWDDIN